MFSMAGVSLFLPFLPLLPKQILLMNLMTDMPEMTISTDNVDMEIVERPRQWDIKFIRKFMIVFGLLSTIFDYATFGTLFFVLHSVIDQFRTAWFMESVISASMIVLVIRTRKPLFKSKPRKHLLIATLSIVGTTALYFLVVGVIVLLYIIAAEIVKEIFYKRVKLETSAITFR
jgi:Mg2+-importing ATPase